MQPEVRDRGRTIPVFEFSDRLRKARELKGLTSHQLSKELGMNVTAVSHWERGGKPHDFVKVVRRLAEILEVDFLWLLTGEGAATDGYPAFLPSLAA